MTYFALAYLSVIVEMHLVNKYCLELLALYN
ncbi:hypothetical protein T06_2318 [Trichinella sp. T6]|nr:hypothetical protein T06_2318 [Trichinella sp. T6]